MRTVLCPGSFDPVTNGHMDIIRRAAAQFERVIVLVAINATKPGLFAPEERVKLLQRCLTDVPNAEVRSFAGLTALYAKQTGASAIVKGLRAMSDFDYEFQQALTNRQLNPAVETIFMSASGESMYLSSGMVKQVCSLGGDVSSFVPPEALPDVLARLRPQDKQ